MDVAHESQNKLSGTGMDQTTDCLSREVAIQANDYEIERTSGVVPARKRYIPIKFSDYRVFAGDPKEDENEDTEDKFDPEERRRPQSVSQPNRRRGRPRKVIAETANDNTTDDSNKKDNEKAPSISKVSNGFKCNLCGRIFTLKGNAKAHLKTHSDERPFPCTYKGCGKSLRTKKALHRHQMSHLGIKAFECSECKKKFTTNASLQEHITTHTGEKPVSCPICKRKFRQQAVMRRHLTTHSSEKPFACGVCGKRFAMKVYVQSHLKTHTGERPYTCNTCSKSFAHSSDLKRHKIIHTGEKPYACSICPMRYSDISSRKRHEREHHNRQQFICRMCHQNFSKAGQLRNHMIKHHNTEPEELFKESVAKGDWGAGKNHSNDVETSVHMLLSQSSSLADVIQTGANDSQVFSDNHQGLEPGVTYKLIELSNGSKVYLELKEPNNDIAELSTVPNVGTLCDQPAVVSSANSSIPSDLIIVQSDADPKILLEKTDTETQDQVVSFVENNARDSSVGAHEDVNGNPDSLQTVAFNNTNFTAEVHFEQSEAETRAVGTPPSQSNTNVTGNVSSIGVGPGKVAQSYNGNETTIIVDTQKLSSQQVSSDRDNEGLSYAIIQEHTEPDYVYSPDFESQRYYDWLSIFTEECKLTRLPLDREIFQKISHVQKTLTDFMASPSGVITDKNNFKVLMSITKDLGDIVSKHLLLMYQNLS